MFNTKIDVASSRLRVLTDTTLMLTKNHNSSPQHALYTQRYVTSSSVCICCACMLRVVAQIAFDSS